VFVCVCARVCRASLKWLATDNVLESVELLLLLPLLLLLLLLQLLLMLMEKMLSLVTGDQKEDADLSWGRDNGEENDDDTGDSADDSSLNRGAIHLWRPHGGGQAAVDSCGCGRGSASCGHPLRKLEPTDVILSPSHAKKFGHFVPEFRVWME